MSATGEAVCLAAIGEELDKEALLLPCFFFTMADVENGDPAAVFDLGVVRTAEECGVTLEGLPHGESTRADAATEYDCSDAFEAPAGRVHGLETTTACAPVRRLALKTAFVAEDKSEACDVACRTAELGIMTS